MSPRGYFPYKGGEEVALQQLDGFILRRLNGYMFNETEVERDAKEYNTLINDDYNVRLAPWLANGSLSCRKVYHDVKKLEGEFDEVNQSVKIFMD